jgi:hypothetical protein
MANFFKDLVKSFTFRGTMKSNILSTSYTTIGVGTSQVPGNGLGPSRNSTFSTFTATRYLSSWYQKLEELKDYETTEISNIVVEIFKDFIANYFADNSDLIALPQDILNNKLYSDRINEIFRQIALVTTIKKHLKEIIYYSGYAIKIDWDPYNKKWKKYELQNPYNTISVRSQGQVQFNLVVSRDRKIVQVAPNAILRISTSDLHLLNDISQDLVELDEVKDQLLIKDTIVSGADLIGSSPLYYNLIAKIKEYLIKDQLVSLLSIKDLIQPLLLLIRVDKKTDPTEANNLAVNTENLINKYSDMSAIFGANFSIMDLMDSVLNNIRVLPDYHSAMGDMNSIDLSKISNKIQEIKADQDNLKESIYSNLGIPRSLFAGDTTKWEAIKSSQRLNNKVSSIINGINDSVAEMASILYHLLTNKEVDPTDIVVNLFTKTDVDLSNAINAADITNQLLESINRALETAQRFMQDNKLIDPAKYMENIKIQLKTVDPNILDYVTDEKIKEYIKELQSAPDEGSGGFGGGSRFSDPKISVGQKLFSLIEEHLK